MSEKIRGKGSVRVTSCPMTAINLMHAAINHPVIQTALRSGPSNELHDIDVDWEYTESLRCRLTFSAHVKGVGEVSGYCVIERTQVDPEMVVITAGRPHPRDWHFQVGPGYELTLATWLASAATD